MIERWRCYGIGWLKEVLRDSATPSGALLKCAYLVAVVCLTACQEQIVHDLSERDANRVINHLSEARLHPRKIKQPDGRWAIAVAHDEMVPALGYLDTRRVLARRDTTAGAGKGTIIPSREEQWFRYERSVALSIEESLSTLPGVLEARVHLNLPDDDPLLGEAAPGSGSGSVLLVVDSRFSAGEGEVSELVGGAAGLKPELVRILTSTTSETLVPALVGAAEPTSLPAVSMIERVVPTDLSIVAIVMFSGLIGLRLLRRRSKKRVRFQAPKELEFEG